MDEVLRAFYALPLDQQKRLLALLNKREELDDRTEVLDRQLRGDT